MAELGAAPAAGRLHGDGPEQHGALGRDGEKSAGQQVCKAWKVQDTLLQVLPSCGLCAGGTPGGRSVPSTAQDGACGQPSAAPPAASPPPSCTGPALPAALGSRLCCSTAGGGTAAGGEQRVRSWGAAWHVTAPAHLPPHRRGNRCCVALRNSSNHVSLCVIFYLGNASSEGLLLGDEMKIMTKCCKPSTLARGSEQPALPRARPVESAVSTAWAAGTGVGTRLGTAATLCLQHPPRRIGGSDFESGHSSSTALREGVAEMLSTPPPQAVAPTCPQRDAGAACTPLSPNTIVSVESLLHAGLLPALVSLCVIASRCQGSHLSSAAYTGAGANPADAVQSQFLSSARCKQDAGVVGRGLRPGGAGADRASCVLGNDGSGKARTRHGDTGQRSGARQGIWEL